LQIKSIFRSTNKISTASNYTPPHFLPPKPPHLSHWTGLKC